MTHRPFPQLTFNPAATNKRTREKFQAETRHGKRGKRLVFSRAGGPFAFVCEGAHLRHPDRMVLSANREALPMTDNQDSYTATAPLWIVLLGIIIAIEIGALPVTRAILVAVLP